MSNHFLLSFTKKCKKFFMGKKKVFSTRIDENRIKELKIGFGMQRMPCGQFEANATFFRIGVVAYNIFRLFILKTLSTSWHRHQVQTVRWRLYQIAGKIVFHGGQVFLKVRRGLCQLFADIRLRIWEFANT